MHQRLNSRTRIRAHLDERGVRPIDPIMQVRAILADVRDVNLTVPTRWMQWSIWISSADVEPHEGANVGRDLT